MWPVSQQFLTALRYPGRVTSTATYRNVITGATAPLQITDGQIVDDATAAVRRTLSLTVPGLQPTWDLLDSPGGEITVRQTWVYGNGSTEPVPMGVFIVDQDTLDYSASGDITLTAPDRWNKVVRNRFGLSRASVATNTAWQEIERLTEGAWPGTSYPFPGWSQLDKSATTKVGQVVWDDGDRAAAITSMCTDNSVEAFFDRLGKSVLRPVPVLTTTSPYVWSVDAGPTGVMTAASRQRDRSQIQNVILVSTSATDVTFTTVEVKNTTAGDPLSVNGPLGYVPFEYSSPTLRSSAQARAAGLTLLSKHLGEAQQLTLEAVSNPALDSGDVIQVKLPKIDRNTARPIELHIIDQITHPLVQSGGQTQQILTRSTRPDTDGT